MICVYHRVDFDGHCAAAIVKKRFPDCELVGLNYGDEVPWDKFANEDVVMVDYSLQPHDEMKKLIHMCRSLTWLEHHSAAIEDGKADFEDAKNVQGMLTTKFSGCELAWKYFYEDMDMPTAVMLLGRWDVWDHEADKRCVPFQFGMRGYQTDPNEHLDFWKPVLNDDHTWMNIILEEGKIIERYQRKEWRETAKAKSFEVEFNQYSAIAMNTSLRGSDLFEGVYDEDEHDLMVVFGWDGKEWSVSLYSTKEEVDCGAIAKQNGGGGHKGAAGFRTKKLNMIPTG